MANNDLGMKFSNDIYATKQDVIKQMNIPFVDNIWSQILQYRNNFSSILSLKHITGENYSVCLTPMISQRICAVERKLTNLMVSYSKLSGLNKNNFDSDSFKEILFEIAKKYNLEVTDDNLTKIIEGSSDNLEPKYIILFNYLKALNEIKNKDFSEIDDNFLGRIYSLLLGTDDLTEFYRVADIKNNYSKSLLNKIYIGVPVNAIETSMNSLFNFIRNNNISLFVKACCAYYFIYYVRPFEYYSEEVGTLLFKEILSHDDLGPVCSLLNLEKIFDNKEDIEKQIIESQKNRDLTYFLDYMIKKTIIYLEDFSNKLTIEKKKQIVNENYALDNSKVDSPKDVVYINKNIQENQDTILENTKQSPINYTQSIAISNISEGLSEEEACKFEIHLREKYPDLSSNQAYFYARHCTLGMKYTILQFKKSCNCAYETARTSMDGLVNLGFYRKENLKNKFIYTPVKRG